MISKMRKYAVIEADKEVDRVIAYFNDKEDCKEYVEKLLKGNKHRKLTMFQKVEDDDN